MILKSYCQFCSCEVQPGKACTSCGAPSTAAVLKAPELEPGFALYQNAWDGYALMYPLGWQPNEVAEMGVNIVAPSDEARLELKLLPPQSMLTATQHIELIVRTQPGHMVEILPDALDHYARAILSGPQWEGMISVSLSAGGGTVAVAKRAKGSSIDIEKFFAKMLGSLCPIATIARERWAEPSEGAFSFECPPGWDRQAHLNLPSATAMRTALVHVAADPTGQIFWHVEGEARAFMHGNPSPPPEPGGGFWGAVGRFVSNVGQALSGHPLVPFQGLRPAIELYYMPAWQQAIPGCELIGVEETYKADKVNAAARVVLPGNVVRLLFFSGRWLPPAVTGVQGLWFCCLESYIQAPSSLIGKFEPIFAGMAKTYKVNPNWTQREEARSSAAFNQQQAAHAQQQSAWMQQSMAAHNQRMANIQAMGQASTAAYQVNQEIADMSMAGYYGRQDSSERIQHQTMNGIYERDDVINPATGQVYNVSIHQANHWDTGVSAGGGQNVVASSNLSLQPPPSWTPLERWNG